MCSPCRWLVCRASGWRNLARDGAAEGGADTGGSAKQAQAKRDGDNGNPRAAGAAGPAGQPAFAPAHRRQQPQRARLVRQPASQSIVCRARLVRQPAWKSVTSYKHCCLSGTSSDIMLTLLQLATGAPGIITATRPTICGDSSSGPALLRPACRALR